MSYRIAGSAVAIALGTTCFLAGATADVSRPESKPELPVARAKKIDFNRDVRPILSEHCFRCHGPDAAAVAGDLRLDIRDSVIKDRGGYRAVTPGDPKASLILERAGAKDDGYRMPPADSGMAPLTTEQIEILTAWIASGAEYRPHWAFVPPQEPALPLVHNGVWVRDPLDSFVLAGLEEAGLTPENEADIATLVRRASLVLTGLPPHPGTVDRVLSSKSPTRYENFVDELLASPQYGEHQARYWLDAVRYGDTHGLHLDNERTIWPYRDWVVGAFNRDLPYDNFVTWQLAGDLLPNPTTEQLVATGFVRMNPTTAEGGSIEEEVLVKNTFDRTDTAMTVLTGLTVGCAKCHDHKYDPITQKEYYGLFAFFNNTEDAPLDGNAKLPPPIVDAPSIEEDALIKRWQLQLLQAEQKVDDHTAAQWVAGARTPLPTVGGWQVSPVYSETSFDLAYEKESTPTAWKPIEIVKGKNKDSIIVKENSYVYLRTTLDLTLARSLVLRLGSDDAIKVWANGKPIHENKTLRGLTPDADTVTVDLNAGKNELVFKIVNAGGGDGFVYNFGDPRSERIERAYLASRKPAMSASETKNLRQTFLLFGPDSGQAVTYRTTSDQLAKLLESVPKTLVAQEKTKMPRTAYLLRRGEYDQRGEEVKRGIPRSLGTMPASAPLDRLGLAQWMVSNSNPLLTRVYVNRVWQQCFGKGLVQTAENFGNQGSWPSDKELLDFLATEFRKGGMSTKTLLRRIVTSATFRQASTADSAKRAKDPENLLLSRGPRFRLDAEVVRDQALAVSGLLSPKMGGPGVKTYQPPGLWEAVAYTSSNTAKYVQDHGEALYRRSLYLFWKRTSPPPVMSVFDAPTREACIMNRSRTNTPLQALISMNGTQFVEAARAMAQRVIESARDDRSGIAYVFELAVSRKPTGAETEIVLQLLAKSRKEFAEDSAKANALLAVGESSRNENIALPEHAAWTVVCNMALNLDETLTVH